MKIGLSVEQSLVNCRNAEFHGEGSTPKWLHEDPPVKITTITSKRNSTDHSNGFTANNNRKSRITNWAGDNERSGGGANIT